MIKLHLVTKKLQNYSQDSTSDQNIKLFLFFCFFLGGLLLWRINCLPTSQGHILTIAANTGRAEGGSGHLWFGCWKTVSINLKKNNTKKKVWTVLDGLEKSLGGAIRKNSYFQDIWDNLFLVYILIGYCFSFCFKLLVPSFFSISFTIWESFPSQRQ